MFAHGYDPTSLSVVAIYSAPLTADDYECSITSAQEMTRDCQRTPTSKARVIVVVEAHEPLPGSVRRRMAAADKGIPLCDFAFVTRSVLARAAMNAFFWLSPERNGRRRKVFESFEDARQWLVDEGASGALLDQLHLDARGQLAAVPSER